jgi:hypothetical protein
MTDRVIVLRGQAPQGFMVAAVLEYDSNPVGASLLAMAA